MDLRSFFEKGYDVSFIPKEDADLIFHEMKKLEFLYPDKIMVEKEHPVYDYNSGLFYCDCTTPTTAERPPLAVRDLKVNSDIFSEFWKKISESHLSWFNQNFGIFTRLSKQFHQFKRHNYLKFHFDYKDASPVIAFLYVGDNDFDYSDGGYLEVGKCSVDENFEIKSVLSVDKILPNHGTLIFINNFSPFFVHAVPELKVKKNRFTAVCQFGYSESVLFSLNRRNWSIL